MATDPPERSTATADLAAGALVFASSAAVLILEILAARLLAPYIGVRLETYTGIIGVVLAGISAGSVLGGRLADRIDPRVLLGPVIVAGGLSATWVPVVVDAVGPRVRGGSAGAIVVLAMVGLFLPALLLSAVTPTVAKLQLHSLSHTGRVVGRLSAIGTAGALFGTFFSGFFLVAALPTRRTVFAVGLAMVAIGVITWFLLARSLRATPVLLAVLLVGAAGGSVGGPCALETTYYCVQIVEDEDRTSGRTLVLDDLRHSYIDLEDPTHLEFAYTQAVASVIDAHVPPGSGLRALHIGGGGFSIPRYLRATRQDARSTVLELDRRLVEVGREHLGLQLDEGLQVRTGDARLTIADEPDGHYDVVVGDAFGGLAVPWHLTTVEFVEMVRAKLDADGLYVVNIIDYPPHRFVAAEAATFEEVFEDVAVVSRPDVLRGEAGGNVVLVGSDRPIDLDAVRRELRGHPVTQDILPIEDLGWLPDLAPLTDDWAPVDQLLASDRGA